MLPKLQQRDESFCVTYNIFYLFCSHFVLCYVNIYIDFRLLILFASKHVHLQSEYQSKLAGVTRLCASQEEPLVYSERMAWTLWVCFRYGSVTVSLTFIYIVDILIREYLSFSTKWFGCQQLIICYHTHCLCTQLTQLISIFLKLEMIHSNINFSNKCQQYLSDIQ